MESKMATRTVEVKLPVGRPAYVVVTDKVRYDAKGNWLGHEAVLIEETFSEDEARVLRQYQGCPECGGIGEHKSYFVSDACEARRQARRQLDPDIDRDFKHCIDLDEEDD